MRARNQYIVFDGDVIAANEPVVPVVSRGLMYGDGIFETFRTYKGHTFKLGEHIDRLMDGLELLGITAKPEFNISTVQMLVHKLLKKQNLLQTDAIIRMQVWRGGGRGYHPEKNTETHFSITASVCPDDFTPPTLATVETKRIPSQSLPSHVKLTNGINYILAGRQAAQKGADDALMQTVDGYISETTIANIFWCKGETIFTPATTCDLIPGITRKVIIDLINEQKGLTLKEGEFLVSQIADADTVWMSNSVRELLPVAQIDNFLFNPDHPVIKMLHEQFTAYRNVNSKRLQEDG